jgi:Zn-dependent protease
VQNFLLALPVLLFSMVAHEYAHGYAALKQGDQTALMLGRLTFNPIKHIDPFMTILLPAMLWFGSGGRMMFGGAKPVPVNPRNYRNYRSGDIIVSSAGIVVNLILAVVFVAVSIGIGLLGRAVDATSVPLALLQYMALIGINLNLLLAFFNLIPIPPLDGSHLLYHALPAGLGARYRALSGYGLLILPLLLFMTPGVFSVLLYPARALSSIAMAFVAPYALEALPGL